ncbi:type I secretion system permease/ATPase [Rhizobium oryzicola]|uniref:Type I secretion system permease/ATPase n=1 Tax=Rhizobium oryzicola TaxID=1232668 RepID=A0ABT8T6J4_9HYPH|nr:type I secretion system permease/ATPase [Rhizobium oryzicola]MDO1585578.1 type I secretion system permease/ATPase [Rhizobium oryzicola]
MKANPFQQALTTYRTIIIATMSFSVAINVLMFVSPLYMLQVYDRVLHSRSEMTLMMLTLIALAMLALYGLLEWIRSRVLVRAGMRFDEMIAKGVFSRVITSTLRHPQGRTEFALMDIDRLREFLTGSGLIALCDLPWMPIFLAVCFFFHPLIGWISTVGAVIVFALAIANEFMTKKELSKATVAGQGAMHFSNSTLMNVEVIRALGMEDSLRGRWGVLHRNMLEHQAVASDRSGALLSISKFVRMGLQTIILGAGAYLALEAAISPGSIIAASIMMGRALQPVDQVVGQWKQFLGARQAYARLNKIFVEMPEEEDKLPLPAPSGTLVVEQLAVAAPGGKAPLVHSVTFQVNPGEAVAIVGPSGAGKSSLVRALVGIWAPAAGTIRLDGSELQHWEANALGRHLGYLPQSVELFAGTIAENISRFQEDATPESIIEAAKLANVHQLIQNLPDGYDTQIGVGGRQLSGGQRQRVGLARALYGSPSVIVLDEPNANLDSEGEEALNHVIQQLKTMGKSILFVSHKMSLVAMSDKTLVLAQGRMQGYGATRDLLQPKPAVTSIHPNNPTEAGAERSAAV